MDLSAFKASNANTPAFCHFKDLDDQPIHTDAGEPVGVYLLGQDSDTLTALASQQTNRFLNQRTPGAGVDSGSLVRKIAVPGTETGACSLLRSIDLTKEASGMSVCRVLSCRILVPRRHVHMTMMMAAAISTGT